MVVERNLDALLLKFATDGFGQFVRVDVEMQPLGRNHQISVEHRIVVHIAAAHVQHPRHIVERADHVVRHVEARHLGLHKPQLFVTCQPGIRQRNLCHLVERQRLAAGKELVYYIDLEIDRNPELRKCGRHFVVVDLRQRLPVHADHASRRQHVGQIRNVVGHIFLLLPEQFDVGAAQLLFGLQKIARIGPKPDMVSGDDQRAGRAVESAQIFAKLPMIGRILAAMRVFGRHYVCVDAKELHLAAHFYQILCYIHLPVFFLF